MKIQYKKITIFLIVIYLSIIYLPYIFKGGFVVDDWAIAAKYIINKDFISILNSWFPLLAYRPIVALIYSFIAKLFGLNSSMYIAFNIVCFILAILIIIKTLREYTNYSFSIIFLVLASVPVFASSIIFASVSMVNYNSSLLLWSISFYLLIKKYLNNKKVIFFALSYFLILLAFLIYEGFAPFLVISFLLPILIEYNNSKNNTNFNIYKTTLKYFLPIILVLLIAIFYQKIIVIALGGANISRLHISHSLMEINISIIKWITAVFIDFPILLVTSIQRIGLTIIHRVELIFLIIISSAITYFMFKFKTNDNERFNKKEKVLFGTILFLALLSNNLITILSGYGSSVAGYSNRILASTWITLALALSYVISQKQKYYYCFTLLIVLFSCSFIIQRDNYIASFKLQNIIVDDCIKEIKESTATQKDLIVLGNVPLFLLNNYNDEQVFDVSWDFGTALNIKSNGLIKEANILTKDKINLGRVKLTNQFISIDDWQINKENWPQIYYYEFDQKAKKSSLVKINNYEDLQRMIKGIEVSKLLISPRNTRLIEFDSKLKTSVKKLLQVNH